jgi:hypothetical protein
MTTWTGGPLARAKEKGGQKGVVQMKFFEEMRKSGGGGGGSNQHSSTSSSHSKDDQSLDLLQFQLAGKASHFTLDGGHGQRDRGMRLDGNSSSKR